MESLELEKQIQVLQEIDQQKDQFLSQVTHDLRAPLNVVNYLLKEIEKLCQNNQLILKNIEMCKCNSDMLMSLINDILDYAQLKENQMKLNLQSFSLKNTLVEIQVMLQILFELKQIKLIFYNLIQPQDDILYSDQRRLKQVLINLLTNALKFTISGEVTVIAKVFHTDGSLLKFQVQDTGIGIEEEKIKQLGIPYSTFNEQNLNNCGIGMGLFICKKIIGKLGPSEDLFIQSKIGVGSKFGFVVFKSIQQANDHQIYNFKSFFQIATKKSTSRIFSFDKLSYQDEDQNKKLQNVFNTESKYKTVNKAIYHKQQSLLLSNSPQSFLQPLKQQKKMVSVQFESKIQDPDIEYLEEFQQFQEINYYTPHNYNTKPKKQVINTRENQLEQFYNSETDSVLQYEDFPEKYIVMIADDDAFNHLILNNYLQNIEMKQIEIIKAFNGQQAINLFMDFNQIEKNTQRISVILMDCMMPILDGYAATKKIKDLIYNGAYCDCTVIAYTGKSGIEEEQKCKITGFDAYLFKPASKNDVIAAINNHLS